MKRILPVLGLIVPVLGMAAERVMSDARGNEIRLRDTPCVSTSEALSQIPPEARKNMKSASVFWVGKRYEACWGALGDGRVLIFDEAGDAGILPESAFRQVHGT